MSIIRSAESQMPKALFYVNIIYRYTSETLFESHSMILSMYRQYSHSPSSNNVFIPTYVCVNQHIKKSNLYKLLYNIRSDLPTIFSIIDF